MKVRNIMFTGFMAAILSATGAHAAISVASQGYVDSKVGDVATSVSTLSTTVADTYQTKADATSQHEVLQNAINGKVAKADYDVKIKALEDADAATNEYVGTIPDTATAKNIVAYVQEKTAGIATDTALEELTGRVATAEGKVTSLETLTGENGQIAKDIADALQAAKDYADANDAEYDDTALAARVTANEGAISAIQGEQTTQNNKITALEGQFGETGTTTVAIKAAQDAADAAQDAADAAQGTADANAAAIEAINDAEDGILAQAKADAATKLAGAMEDIAEAYLAKPAACATAYCVLSVNGENVSWMPLTEPQATYYPEK